MKKFLGLLAGAALAAPAFAGLVDTRTDTNSDGATVDQSISAGEYGAGNAYSYGGAGSGFGGTVGNGVLYMESDATNLYIGFQAAGGLDNLVTVMLDTKAGGFTDAGMNDNSDGGRRASSQQSINADDAYAPGFLPDYSLIIGNFGTVLFELTADPNPLNFLAFDGTTSAPVREYAIPLASLGLTPASHVDFFVAYISDSGYGSNESIPAYGPLNSGPNPGFDPVSAGYGNFDRFNLPEPTTALLLGLAAFALRRR